MKHHFFHTWKLAAASPLPQYLVYKRTKLLYRCIIEGCDEVRTSEISGDWTLDQLKGKI